MADRWELLAASFARSQRAQNRSEKTVKVYREAIERLGSHLLAQGIHDPAEVNRAHIEAFLTEQLARLAPATVNSRYRALQQWFKWLEVEEEITANPMRHTRPPSVPESLVPVLSDTQLGDLFATCAGKTFVERRDQALLRVFHDTGCRRAEAAGMLLERLSLDDRVIVVLGKGSRERMLPFGPKTAAALDRYVRARSRERTAALAALWLSEKGRGAFTADGIAQMMKRRGAQAGIPDLHPHMLRHTFASAWMENGGGETDLMQLAGWRSRQMLSRYGASAAAHRARQAHQRMGLGDRV